MNTYTSTMITRTVTVITILLAVSSCSIRDRTHKKFTDSQLNMYRVEFEYLDSAITSHALSRADPDSQDSLLNMINRLLDIPREVLTEDQTIRQAYRYVSASGIYISDNRIEEAFSILDEGLRNYEDLAFKSSYYSISQAMTLLFFNYAMYNQADMYADRAIKAALIMNDSAKLCIAYANKSWIADRISGGNKDSAYRYITLARQFMPSNNSVAGYITETYAGHIYAPDPDSAAIGLRHLEKCRKQYSSILNHVEGRSYMPYNMGRAYAAMGKDRTAQKYFRQAIEDSKNEPVMIRNEVLSGIMDYYFKTGMYDEATAILPEWYETTKIRHETVSKYAMAYWNAKFRDERQAYELQLTRNNLKYSRLRESLLATSVILLLSALTFFIFRAVHLRRQLAESYIEMQRRTARWNEIACPHNEQMLRNEYTEEDSTNEGEGQEAVTDEKKLAAMRVVYERVKEVMTNDKPFLSPDFTLNDLSNMVYCNRSLLSATINQFYGANFSNTVSEYRVNYFIDLLKDSPPSRIDELWTKAGFPSRSSFFRQFKSITKMTPTQYWEQMIKHK